jgi:hypothetical protein
VQVASVVVAAVDSAVDKLVAAAASGDFQPLMPQFYLIDATKVIDQSQTKRVMPSILPRSKARHGPSLLHHPLLSECSTS